MPMQRLIELGLVLFTSAWILIAHSMDTEGRISKLEAYQETILESNAALKTSVDSLNASINRLEGQLSGGR